MRQARHHKKVKINKKRLTVTLLTLILLLAGITVLLHGCGPQGPTEEELEEQQRLEEERRQEEERQRQEEEKRQAEEKSRQDRMYAYENGFLMLLNKEHSVDENYKAEDMVMIAEEYCCPDRSASTRYMREEAVVQFQKMLDAGRAEGQVIKMTTAYRSYWFQKTLWDNYVKKDGEAAAARYSARPGTSEHQSGLAVDVSSASVDWYLRNAFGETPEGKWLAEHCAEYGFILRYPVDGEEKTGYMYEPWHVRYVTAPVAKEITEKGLVLEEYLALYDWENGGVPVQ
ncbi:MAG: M15 family metallopeptidase [Firmicutes bacterium]|nr:M15 family metallopeptidase [Bacillota bacterium]